MLRKPSASRPGVADCHENAKEASLTVYVMAFERLPCKKAAVKYESTTARGVVQSFHGVSADGGAPLGPDAYIAHVDGLDGPTMVYPSG